MFNTKSVPPMPMIVRDPSRVRTGMSTREVRKPMPSVCHGCRALSAVNIARWLLIVAAALLLVPARIAGLTEVMTDADITLPAFDLLLGDRTLLPINALRTPHITPATGEPGTRDLINDATIEIFYNAPTVDDRVLPVRILSEGGEQTRASVDFSRIQ